MSDDLEIAKAQGEDLALWLEQKGFADVEPTVVESGDLKIFTYYKEEVVIDPNAKIRVTFVD